MVSEAVPLVTVAIPLVGTELVEPLLGELLLEVIVAVEEAV